jgi:hypothetical protein
MPLALPCVKITSPAPSFIWPNAADLNVTAVHTATQVVTLVARLVRPDGTFVTANTNAPNGQTLSFTFPNALLAASAAPQASYLLVVFITDVNGFPANDSFIVFR